MKLINRSLTYEVKYPEKDVPVEEQPVFVLRRLSGGEVDLIDDETAVSRGQDSFAYLAGTASKMKIRMAVTDWKNVFDDTDKPAPCNDTTKDLLPAEVRVFLVKRIDLDNGLSNLKERKNSEKN